MIVPAARTCEATVPIMVNAMSAARMSFAVLPKRRSKSSGMDVILWRKPTSEMRPEMPEKMNMPSRYGSAVMIAMKPPE